MQKTVSIVTGPPKDYLSADTLQEAIDQAWAMGGHIHHARGSEAIHRFAICRGDCLKTALTGPEKGE